MLHRHNKFYPNWMITERVMTLCRFFKMAAMPSQILYFRFLVLCRLKELFTHQTSTRYLNPRPSYYYLWLLPYLNSTSGFDFELFTIIGMWFCTDLLNFVRNRRSATELWRHIDLTRKDGGHSVANLLPVSGLTISDISEGLKLSAHQSLTRYLNALPIYYYTSGFDFDPFTVIGMWFSIGAPNFIKIGSFAAELWRHSDFQDGGRQPCWIWFRAIVAHPRSASGGLCFVLKFRLDRIYSFGDRAIFIFWHFGLKLPTHAHF